MKRLQLKLDPLTRQRAIVCRGTSCYLTKAPGAEDWNHVTKFSWTSDRQKPEAELLKLANQRGVEGIARLVGHRSITSIKEMRAGLMFEKPYSFRGSSSAGSFFLQSFSQSKPSSVLSRSFSESPLELLEALRDAIKAHRSLYSKGKILHRDISENNIIITEATQYGHAGMLIDMDLAKELGTGRSGACCRTGTMEFMTIDVLLNTDHTYQHDLESFFYVLIWQCARRGWEFVGNWKCRPSPSLLTKWYTGSYEDIAIAKELRGILFPIHGNAIFTGTPKDSEILYELITKAFDHAIDVIRKVGR
ncbi:hypothetical protein CIHG_06230 [Coccidioides immitis H538.4]|uniref:EKC/KEOPS complex subunit BUD32 n=3 Tax=Coccidioides immitis TaxID=5501 RepID=A0A0J8TNI4_COCIT|nr:hypothetical protein CIRG_09508 [Coccidioides immitis RMSCC 2394]KMU75277.1 hypothetical protein CISG_04696 [Coccidioides immitis RMSCC 3703]KMU88430.1 hypothetical protein CIHG_06230 [Coccidioides immitis H538.4]